MIERAEVDGKPATIAYIGDDFQPADKDTALYIKVIFDDGTSLFARNEPVAPPQAKDFDPNQPREPAGGPGGGRWTSGGGSGEAHANAEGIPPVASQESLRITNDRWHETRNTSDTFPNITDANSNVIGFKTSRYNCCAFAMGDSERWWWPSSPEYSGCEYWPDGFSRNNSVQNFDELFTSLGAVEVPEKFWNDVQPGWTTVALYVDDDNVPQHLARQTSDGTWISKTGSEELVEHDHLEDMGDGLYGHVAKVYSMKTEDWRALRTM